MDVEMPEMDGLTATASYEQVKRSLIGYLEGLSE